MLKKQMLMHNFDLCIVQRRSSPSIEQLHHAKSATADGESISGMAAIIGVDRKTLSRALKTR